jgi:hypothetical protein
MSESRVREPIRDAVPQRIMAGVFAPPQIRSAAIGGVWRALGRVADSRINQRNKVR